VATGRPILEDRLHRELGLLDATMVVAGSVIGVGIFTSTGIVAAVLPDPVLLLAAWVLGGVLSLAGALTNAEMGAALPHAGGDYVYLREAFSPLAGFVAGWLTFFVVYCGTAGTLAAGFAEYLAVFAPALSPDITWFQLAGLRIGPGVLASLLALWTTTIAAYWGVREGARQQDAMTVIKLAAIAALCVAGPLVGIGQWSHLLPAAEPAPGAPQGPLALGRAFSTALVPILFTYLGWNAPVFIASELRDPERTLPRALLLGTILVTVVYVVLNAIYLYALPVSAMVVTADGRAPTGIVRIAETATAALFGSVGSQAISALVLVSIVGCLHATVLVGARIVYAMALDRTMPLALSRVHPTRGTPHVALFVQAIVASLLIGSGSFQQILNYTTFALITLMICDGLALYRLRRRDDLPRPYTVWGYPWVPAAYVAASVLLWWNTLIEVPAESLIGLAIAATGVPAYYLSQRG
jgi:basic amino acid/polyamine antiporter, APA family